jgi:hypothetical protein
MTIKKKKKITSLTIVVYIGLGVETNDLQYRSVPSYLQDISTVKLYL